METVTVRRILSQPNIWQEHEVDATGWCLRATELSVFADTLDDVISWIRILGARRSATTGIHLDIQPDLLPAFDAAAIRLDELWSADLRHRWPGSPKLAKLRVQGEVLYQPTLPGNIIIGRYEPIIIKAVAVQPQFDGVVEWSNYRHSREEEFGSESSL